MFPKELSFILFLSTISFASFAQRWETNDVKFFVAEDAAALATLRDISQLEFRSLNNNVLRHDVTKSAIWIRFKVSDTSLAGQFLELSCPNFADVTYYQPSIGGHYAEYKTGMYQDFDNRPVPIDRFAFLIIPGTAWHYVRIRTSHSIYTEFNIKDKERVVIDAASRNVLYSVYMGLMMVLIIGVSFYIYLIRYYSYLFYIGYVLAVSSLALVEKGFYFQILWPHHPMMHAYVYILPFLISSFMLLFLRGIWIQHTLITVLFRINLWMLTLIPFVGSLYFSFTGQLTEAFKLTQVHSVISGLLTVVISIISYIKADKSLRLPLILINVGLCILCIGILIFLSTMNSVVPTNIITDNILIISSTLELCFLTTALVIRSDEIYKKQRALLSQGRRY